MNGTPSETEPIDTDAPQLPLFYKKVVVLDENRHGDKFLIDGMFPFAAESNAIPLNGIEFRLAVTEYPIVFINEDPFMPVIIVGLKSGENLLVNDDGRWDEGCYVPAYVRRYPFIFLESESKETLTLCIDEEAEILNKNGSIPLFEDKKPSENTNRILEFCRVFQGHHENTIDFTKALAEHDMLVEKTADAQIKDGGQHVLGGFRVIDEEKLRDLPSDLATAWHKNGWLPLIYFHLASQNNWASLLDRQVNRDA